MKSETPEITRRKFLTLTGGLAGIGLGIASFGAVPLKLEEPVTTFADKSLDVIANSHPLLENFAYPVEIKNEGVANQLAEHQVRLTNNTLKVGDKTFYTFSEKPESIEIIAGNNKYGGFIKVEIGSAPLTQTIFFAMDITQKKIDKIENTRTTDSIDLPEKLAPISAEQKKIFEMMKAQVQKYIPTDKITFSDIGEDFFIYQLANSKRIECQVQRSNSDKRGVKLVLIEDGEELLLDKGQFTSTNPDHTALDLYLKIFSLDLNKPKEIYDFLQTNVVNKRAIEPFIGLIDFNPNATRGASNPTGFGAVFDFEKAEHIVENFSPNKTLITSKYSINKDRLPQVFMDVLIKNPDTIHFSSNLSLFQTSYGKQAEKSMEEHYPYKVKDKLISDLNPAEKLIFREFLFQLLSDYENRRKKY